LLGKEQVGALDNVLEVWLALGVDKVRDVRDIDCLGSSTTGYKEIGLDSEMEVVSEISSIGNDLAGYWSATTAEEIELAYKEAGCPSDQQGSGNLRVRASPWQRS
jgi:hypothetical protein